MMLQDNSNNDFDKFDNIEQANEQPNERPNAQADEIANEHIITKLDVYFNYIINNKGEQKFENMKPVDKDSIVLVLKRLDLYIGNPGIMKYMDIRVKQDYKVQYWLIHEIYFSPYKMFLNTMTREQFLFRYSKAKKYAQLNHMCTAEKFIKYFMRCIQEEMEATNKINDRKSLRMEDVKKC